jgi:lambda family phage portal protein
MSKRKRKPSPQPPGPAPRRRAYEGAMVSRLTADWVTSSTSADAEIDGSLIRLRNRSRQLLRDNPYAIAARRAIVVNVIGRGIRMQSRVPMLRGGGRLDKPTNDRIEAWWRDYCRKEHIHTAGKLSFPRIIRQSLGAAVESGEVFLRLVPQEFGNSGTSLGVEIIEADYCDETHTSGPDADRNEWRMGVQVNRWGRPLQYRFRTRHPGDVSGSIGYEVKDVPASEIIHLFIPDRPGQTRGAPWFSSIIKRMHHLAGFEEAEVVGKRARSSVMGFIQTPEGELIGDGVEDGERVTNFEPGVFKHLAAGETVTVPQLGNADTDYEDFLRPMLRAFSAGSAVPYPTVSSDYSQSNYSSSRLERLEVLEWWRSLQDWIIEDVCQAIFERAMAAAVEAGTLQLPGYDLMPERYEAVKWFARGWEMLDIQREAAAYKDLVRGGFRTQAQIVAEQGGDLEDLLTARAAEVSRAEELGLQFDTNPADDLQGGAPEAMPEGDSPGEAEDTADDAAEDVAEGEDPEDPEAT